MKVGDLIRDKEFPEAGLIVEKRDNSYFEAYRVLGPFGRITWFSREYIENDCELVSENR